VAQTGRAAIAYEGQSKAFTTRAIAAKEATMKEPIFSRQEQGVVYLFSRYWDKIPLFKNKQLCRIHTHFPDFTIKDRYTGSEEAIEFEYALSDFNHIRQLGTLNKDGIRVLHIVYWDDDTDHKELGRGIRKGYRGHGFSGKLKFVCLSRYFSPSIKRGSDHLDASWEFAKHKHFTEAYSFKAIERDTTKLANLGYFEPLKPDKELYRTVGFNRSMSAYIEWDHWKTIHLFSTSPFQANRIPCKLFVKPTGYHYFSGYFDVRAAFNVTKGGEAVEDYWRNYYFYPYESGYKDSTFLVYSHFTELAYDQGVRLFKYLTKHKYALHIQGSRLIREAEHIQGIDKIVRRRTRT
jgi:hypothetical protein